MGMLNGWLVLSQRHVFHQVEEGRKQKRNRLIMHRARESDVLLSTFTQFFPPSQARENYAAHQKGGVDEPIRSVHHDFFLVGGVFAPRLCDLGGRRCVVDLRTGRLENATRCKQFG